MIHTDYTDSLLPMLMTIASERLVKAMTKSLRDHRRASECVRRIVCDGEATDDLSIPASHTKTKCIHRLRNMEIKEYREGGVAMDGHASAVVKSPESETPIILEAVASDMGVKQGDCACLLYSVQDKQRGFGWDSISVLSLVG